MVCCAVRYDLFKLSRTDHNALVQKLQGLEKQIIIGGENLLEKAQEQEKLLEESSKELEERKKEEIELKKALEEKEVWSALYVCHPTILILVVPTNYLLTLFNRLLAIQN